VLGRGKLMAIAGPTKSTPGAGSTPTRRNTTTTATTINKKNKKPPHDDDKKTRHDDDDEEERQKDGDGSIDEAKEEKKKKLMMKKTKKRGREEEVVENGTTTTQTRKTKTKREAEKRSPPKGKRKGRHLAGEEEGSDDGELSREDSFDLNGNLLCAQRYTRHATRTRVRSRLTFAPREQTSWRTSTAPWWRMRRSHTPRRPPQVVHVQRRHRPSHTSHCVRGSDIRFFTFRTHTHTPARARAHARTHTRTRTHARHTQSGRGRRRMIFCWRLRSPPLTNRNR